MVRPLKVLPLKVLTLMVLPLKVLPLKVLHSKVRLLVLPTNIKLEWNFKRNTLAYSSRVTVTKMFYRIGARLHGCLFTHCPWRPRTGVRSWQRDQFDKIFLQVIWHILVNINIRKLLLSTINWIYNWRSFCKHFKITIVN